MKCRYSFLEVLGREFYDMSFVDLESVIKYWDVEIVV